MIKLAGFFALWEIAKLFIGKEAITAKMKAASDGAGDGETKALGCLLASLELIYIAWSIWLLFTHTGAALVLWGMFFFMMVVMNKFRPLYNDFGLVDSLVSATILYLLALGRIK